jgi:hypothetical protein
MTLSDLQSRLTSLEIVLTARGDRLVVDAPAGVLTAEVKASLATHKEALLRSLAEVKSQTRLASRPGPMDADAVAAIDRAFRPVAIQTRPWCIDGLWRRRNHGTKKPDAFGGEPTETWLTLAAARDVRRGDKWLSWHSEETSHEE